MKGKSRKILLCVVLILLVLVGTAVYALNVSPTQVTPLLLRRIVWDAAVDSSGNLGQLYDRFSVDQLDVSYCYGVFSGCVPVMLNTAVTQALWQEEIAGSQLYYRDGRQILVWKNGEFLPLKEAWEAGWLTESEVAQIAKIQRLERYGTDISGEFVLSVQ